MFLMFGTDVRSYMSLHIMLHLDDSPANVTQTSIFQIAGEGKMKMCERFTVLAGMSALPLVSCSNSHPLTDDHSAGHLPGG